MQIHYDLSEAAYRDGSHFGIHNLMTAERLGLNAFFRGVVGREEPSHDSPAKTIGSGIDTLLFPLGGSDAQQAFDERFAVHPETYTTTEADAELKERLEAEGRATYEADLKEWEAAKAAAKEAGEAVGAWTKEHPKPKVSAYKPDAAAYLQEIEKPWNANAGACATWLSEHAEMTVLSPAQAERIRSIAAGVYRSPIAAPYLRFGMGQVTIRGDHEGLPVQGRFDWLATDANRVPWAIVDGKKVATLGRFWRQIEDLGYDRQAAHYKWLAQQAGLGELPWRWLVYEEEWPYRVAIVKPTNRLIERAHTLNCKLLDEVAEAWNGGAGAEDPSRWPEPCDQGELEADLRPYTAATWNEGAADADDLATEEVDPEHDPEAPWNVGAI